MAQAEGWLKSVETDIDNSDLGRGVHVAIETKPLAMPCLHQTWLWKSKFRILANSFLVG